MATLQEQIDAACAAGFMCITENLADAVKLYNLRATAGLTALTPQELMDAAKCYRCNFQNDAQALEAYLLDQIAA